MSYLVDKQELRTRAKTYSKENYMFIYSVMKGLAVGSAAFTLNTIIQGLANGHERFLFRLPFWVTSFAAMIMTYYAATIGALIWGFLPTLKDIILPFILGAVEFLLFSILGGVSPDDALWHHWYLVFAIFAFVCHLILRNLYSKLKESRYSDDLPKVIEDYMKLMKGDLRDSKTSAILSVIIWAILIFWLIPNYSSWRKWHWLISLAPLGMMIFAIHKQERARLLIANRLEDASDQTVVYKSEVTNESTKR
jgi:hypothetical protein